MRSPSGPLRPARRGADPDGRRLADQGRPSPGAGRGPRLECVEAYRTLRTAIQFLSLDEPKHVIGVTSSVPSEGKTTAVANLAVSFARAGQRVIVVSCDLRRPHVHEFFGIDNQTGLTSVLIGQAAFPAPFGPSRGAPTPDCAFWTGTSQSRGNPLVDQVRRVIDVLAANSDIVLLDCPPVLPVTDALLCHAWSTACWSSPRPGRPQPRPPPDHPVAGAGASPGPGGDPQSGSGLRWLRVRLRVRLGTGGITNSARSPSGRDHPPRHLP